jgi:hypothetical protein
MRSAATSAPSAQIIRFRSTTLSLRSLLERDAARPPGDRGAAVARAGVVRSRTHEVGRHTQQLRWKDRSHRALRRRHGVRLLVFLSRARSRSQQCGGGQRIRLVADETIARATSRRSVTPDCSSSDTAIRHAHPPRVRRGGSSTTARASTRRDPVSTTPHERASSSAASRARPGPTRSRRSTSTPITRSGSTSSTRRPSGCSR